MRGAGGNRTSRGSIDDAGAVPCADAGATPAPAPVSRTSAVPGAWQYPKRPPKIRCVRGHLLADAGWVLNPGRHNGILYHTRRCKACLREDLARWKRGRRAA
jgi:hypothetical protein